MKAERAITWPPLINDAKRPRYVVLRDILLTAGAWLLVFWMARQALLQMADEVWELGGQAAFEPDMDWTLWWRRFWPYGMAIGGITVWLLAWGKIALRRVSHYHDLAPPAPLPLADEAARAGCSEAVLTAWRGLKIAVVELDAAGHLIVTSAAADDIRSTPVI